jgi:hypothetical protein
MAKKKVISAYEQAVLKSAYDYALESHNASLLYTASFSTFRPLFGNGGGFCRSDYKAQACHATAGHKDTYDNGETHLLTLVRNPGGKYNKFFTYICDKLNSPWRSILKGVSLVWHEKIVIGILIKDPQHLPSDLYMNFLIATRKAWEKQATCDLFLSLIDKGVSHVYALYLSGIYALSDTGMKETFHGSAHSHVNPTYTNFELLLGKKPIARKVSIIDRMYGSYYPSHAVWEVAINGYNEDLTIVHKSLRGSIEKFLGNDRAEKKAYAGPFAKRRAKEATINDKLIVPIPLPKNRKEARLLMKAVRHHAGIKERT